MGKPTEVHCINKIYEITRYHIQSQLNCLPWTTLKSQGVTISYTILCNITFSLKPIDNIKFPFEDLSLLKKIFNSILDFVQITPQFSVAIATK